MKTKCPGCRKRRIKKRIICKDKSKPEYGIYEVHCYSCGFVYIPHSQECKYIRRAKDRGEKPIEFRRIKR